MNCLGMDQKVEQPESVPGSIISESRGCLCSMLVYVSTE